MPIYFYENVELVPGETGEYMRAFRERYLPLNDRYEDFNRLSGFFSPDVLYTTSPRVVILWTIPRWERLGESHATGFRRGTTRQVTGFFLPHSSSEPVGTSRVLEPLSFSPCHPYARVGRASVRRCSITSSSFALSTAAIR